MSNRLSGVQDTSKKLGRRNKGIARADRNVKRAEAVLRQGISDPRKSKAFRRGSSYDPSTGKRRPWRTPDWKRHDDAVESYLNTLAAA